MKIKNVFCRGLSLLIFLTILHSCRKQELLNVDITEFYSDSPVKSALDTFITNTLTVPYNIELIYRFNRNETQPDRNISPIELDRVRPSIDAILYTFLKVYEDVAGVAFIKQNTPKQFVLYGSQSYNANGSVTLGTAEGGRKIVLYEMNEIDFNNSTQVRRKMRTIHHEFTHILNQLIAIPPTFEQITKADYLTDWTNNTSNPESISRNLGFISRYARSAYTEDFAELVAHLIVEGQLYVDNYAKGSSNDASSKLKLKEAQVVDYFNKYFDIDFRALQKEFAQVAIQRYNENEAFSLGYWMRRGTLINSIKIDPTSPYNTKYTISPAFNTIYDEVAGNLAATGRSLNFIDFQFIANNQLEVVVNYNNAAGSQFNANYSYSNSISTTNEIVFTKVAQRGTTGVYANANTIRNTVLSLQNYLTSNTFVIDWIVDATANDYTRVGGFYVREDPTNYVFGDIIR